MKKILVILFIVLQYNINYAQHHRFRHLSVDDGLSHNGVFAITQDEKGFIWIGTENGLNRYDGNQIKIFQNDPENKNTLSSNDINCLVSYKNKLWVGTHSGGLNVIDLRTYKIKRYPYDKNGNGKINSEYIQSLELSPDNKIYVGTYDGGINIIEPETDKITYLNTSSEKNLLSNWIKAMDFDNEGNLWIAHPNFGVSKNNLKTGENILFTDTTISIGKINNLNLRTLFCDSKNNVWISTWSAGINVYDQHKKIMLDNKAYLENKTEEEKKKESVISNLNKAGMVFDFSEDEFGNIWIVGVEEGLFCYNPKTNKVRQFKNSPSDPTTICDNNLLSVFTDHSGLVWSGSLSAGLNIFNPYTDRFGYYKAEPENEFGMPNNQVWVTHQGKYSGEIFIGITGNIVSFDSKNDQFKKVIVDPSGKSLLNEQALVQAIYEDSNGNIWFAVNGAGIYYYNRKTFANNHYGMKLEEGGLLHHTASSIVEDHEGKVWVAMILGGINIYHPDTKKFTAILQRKNGFSGNYIRSILLDKNDHLWVATDSGLNEINTKTEKINYHFASKNGLNDNDIYCLYQDKQFLLIGTNTGLSSYNLKTKKFTNLSELHGIGKGGVASIAKDVDGNLWIQGAKGITKVDISDYSARNYDFSDGLQSNEFPYDAVKSLAGGEIIFGGNKGLNFFNPRNLIRNTHEPNVVITNFLLQNKEQKFDSDISFLEEVTLNYDHYFFTVEFAALDYTNTSKNKFKYKLEGFKDEWVEIGNNHQVTFVNLAPGEYTLSILACNNDGIWSKKPAQLKIIITPPFWQTIWFYALCLIMIVLIIYGYIKYREKKLVKEKTVLEDRVNQRTSELREEKEKVEEAHQEIRDSISYAKRLQEAILPPTKMITENIHENFVFYQPKDIVAGDFYWAEKVNNWFFIAAADCTGHGVPGAMVSVVCSNALNRTVKEFGITDTGKILDTTTELVLETFSKSDADVKDGMDISLIGINIDTNEIYWSGANNPLWYTENGEMKEIRADKQPIGKSDNRKPFTSHQINISSGEMIYLITDGYADQFGGEKGKKFKYRPFSDLLINISSLPAEEQKQKLNETLKNWQGDLEQNDDICVIGIKI